MRECLDDLVVIDDKVYETKEIIAGVVDLENVDILIGTWGFPVLPAKTLDRFSGLNAILYAGGSVQSFGRPYLERGVKIFTSKSENADIVAEYCDALFYLIRKGFFKGLRNFAPTTHRQARQFLFGSHVGGLNTVIGLIGFGAIGRRLAYKVSQRGWRVLVYDPYLTESEASAVGVDKVSLEKLFEDADIVSNHLPDKESLNGVLNQELFARMPEQTDFVNTGRGRQVDESGLMDVLAARPDLSVFLDVTHPEPPESTSGLWQLDNVWLTPHLAGCVGTDLGRLGWALCDHLNEILKNPDLESEVKLDEFDVSA